MPTFSKWCQLAELDPEGPRSSARIFNSFAAILLIGLLLYLLPASDQYGIGACHVP
ncbi:hypothetical protein BDZ91DRAFT_794189 [Kalaharituber pfeilii]|nr:hypothetical protein BDZ91DRAFT_794189 [Kalaharituber pfeilii]